MDIKELKEISKEFKKIVRDKKIANHELGIVIELLKLELEIESLESELGIESSI